MKYTAHLMLNNYRDHVHFVINIHEIYCSLDAKYYRSLDVKYDHVHFVMNIHDIYCSLDVK